MPYLVLFATLAFVASPFLTPGFGGFTPDQFPVPQDNPPIQPAGYAFVIWGLIYLLLLVSAVFGVLKRREDPNWVPMRLPLFVSLAIGAGWLPVAQISVLAATGMIWAMLLTALLALRLAPQPDRWLARIPVSIYAGWLTAASFVSLGLVTAGWGVTDTQIAALIWLAMAVVCAVLIQRGLNGAPFYGLTVIWALVGICVANFGEDWLVFALAAFGVLAMLRATGRALRAALSAPV